MSTSTDHRPSVLTERVAHLGTRFWGACSCGWRSPARFEDRKVAQGSAENHAA